MLFYEVKDIVREHLARTTLPTTLLDAALSHGRRIVEQAGQWWWMRQEAIWQLVQHQQPYPINTTGEAMGMIEVIGFPPGTPTNTGSESGVVIMPSKFKVQPISIPGFKDARAVAIKTPTETHWTPIGIGQVSKSEVDSYYSLNEVGVPDGILIENFTIWVYPPFPDQNYAVRFYYWGWTNNPTSNLATDDLIGRFPEALIYAALVWAYEIELKDMEGAAYWRTLFAGKPTEEGQGGEVAKLKRHNFLRMQQDKLSIQPMYGAAQRSRRGRHNQNIWISSGWGI